MIHLQQKKIRAEVFWLQSLFRMFLPKRSNQVAVSTQLRTSKSKGVSDSQRNISVANILTYAGIIVFDLSVGFGVVLLRPILSQTSLLTSIFLAIATTAVVALVPTNSVFWNSTIAKPLEARKLPNLLPWGGDEKVLEVGFGNGFDSLKAAKHVTRGEVTGIEMWGSTRNKKGSPEIGEPSTESGSSKNIGAKINDSGLLIVKNNAVDVVLSTVSFPRSRSPAERKRAIKEMSRVLKPGGWIGLLALGNGGEITKALAENDFKDIKTTSARSFFLASASLVVARKQSNFEPMAL